MRDVSAWLQQLGLGKYARAFEENEIDFDALPHLDHGLLEQMGLPLGPRLKVLAAISELAAQPASAKSRSQVEQRAPERRQLTVMFCDLVDSTELANSLDPEDLKSVMEAYQSACRRVIERYDGHVSQYRGDGVEVYFGWPVAHEDAAERAVRAGLEVVETVRAIVGPRALSVRVGISTGIVVISETGSGDPTTPSGAVGDAPYVAARLQALAAPGTVVVAESTSRLNSARFDQEDLGQLNLKGIADSVHAFRVLKVRDDSSRFQAAHASTLTPLVGRRWELALLQQRWREAREGEGQVIYVSGVPGIGKSRIVHELEQWIGSEPHCKLRLQCLPHNMQSALFPVIQLIQRLAKLHADDSAQAKLDKIELLVAKATDKADRIIPFVAKLISLPIEPRYALPQLPAAQLKSQTLFTLVDLLLDLSAQGPVFCFLEDAQWIDPSTQELLDLVVGQIAKSRILLIVTHRTENQPRSPAQGNFSALTLSRLARREVAELAQLALREREITSDVRERIIEDSDAIPLYVEELARGVRESQGAGAHEATPRRIEASPTLLPDSLRDVLLTRLDRAPQGRRIAQMAAVVGREFTYDMLLHMSSSTPADLESALAELQESEIIQQIGHAPSTRYQFKHALIRDAAYESLLKSTRRELHARVGAAIEREWPDIVAAQPELLAYHYSLASNAHKAVQFWLEGGRRARSRSANLEATVQFQKALEQLESIPESPERNAIELEIQLSLGLCFIAVRGYASDDTRRSFERSRDLSAEVVDTQKEIQALFGLWGHYWMRARHDRAIELSEALLTRAEQLHNETALIVGHRSLGSTLFTLGDFVQARHHLERALRQVSISDGSSLSLSYAVDPRVAAQLMLSWDLWMLGYPVQSRDLVLKALAQAVERAEAYSVAFAHYVTSVVYLLRGEFENSLLHADQSLALSREHRINLYELYSRFGRGCALARMKQEKEAIFEIGAGIEEARRNEVGYMRQFMLGWLATAQVETGDSGAALATLAEARKQVDDVAGRAWEAELLRLYGETLLRVRDGAEVEAEHNYVAAIEVAKRQSARSLELRATTSLARLLQRQNRIDEARERLNPVFGWFTEGFDTADLVEAKALLEQLG